MRHDSSCNEDSNFCSAAPPSSAITTVVFCTPLVATFFAVVALAGLRVFPRLSRAQGSQVSSGYVLPPSAPPSLQQAHSDFVAKSPWQRLAAVSFATAMGLSAVLAELILAEVLGPANTTVRDSALRITVVTLLFLLIIGMLLRSPIRPFSMVLSGTLSSEHL